jgi:hypothetical protein
MKTEEWEDVTIILSRRTDDRLPRSEKAGKNRAVASTLRVLTPSAHGVCRLQQD